MDFAVNARLQVINGKAMLDKNAISSFSKDEMNMVSSLLAGQSRRQTCVADTAKVPT